MRVLLAVLLVGIAGCGGEETSPADVATPSSPVKAENPDAGAAKSKADKPPAQVAVADAVAALKKLGAKIERNEQGEVVLVFLYGAKITDAGLAHLKGLTNLQTLDLVSTKVTDAGLVHIKGLTQLQSLDLRFTKITDAGLVHLKGAGQPQETRPLRNQDHRRGCRRPAEGVTQLQDPQVQVVVISPSPAPALTGVPPRARDGTVVRIWRWAKMGAVLNNVLRRSHEENTCHLFDVVDRRWV